MDRHKEIGRLEIVIPKKLVMPIAQPLSGDVGVSFEFFPPNTEKMEATLWDSVERLAPLSPDFVSVTYGAGGSTRERTHSIVSRIQKEKGIMAAAHLTCVGASKAEVKAVAEKYWSEGIRSIVALRGDPPGGQTKYQAQSDGYAYAVDLVTALKKITDFDISVAAYPEVHPEARSADADLDNLKRKVDAGASRAITQFYFEAETYLRFRDRAVAAGINVPIIPGILPVSNYNQVIKFAAMCGANVPEWMADLFIGLNDDPDTRQLVAATVVAEHCRVLQSEGVDKFHFYTLNRADLVYAICHILGIRPAASHV
jgi:methylenetetrahydrofolate reductase (NADPH)